MLILKVFFLFIGIMYSYSNTINAIHRKQQVDDIFVILQFVGITGFITLQWLI